MKRINWFFNPLKFALATLVVAAAVSNIQAQGLDQATFLELHQSLEAKNEKWKTIPWETDLLVAQGNAAESKKPIFIWAMDGHPLGCT